MEGIYLCSALMCEEIGSLCKIPGATMALISMPQCDLKKEGRREGSVYMDHKTRPYLDRRQDGFTLF